MGGCHLPQRLSQFLGPILHPLFFRPYEDYPGHITKRRITQFPAVLQFPISKTLIIMGRRRQDGILSGVKGLDYPPAPLWAPTRTACYLGQELEGPLHGPEVG